MGYAPDFIQSVMKVLIKPIKKKGRGDWVLPLSNNNQT